LQAIWIVEFYSDHCPFCKSLAPELLKAARASIDKHAGKVRFGGLNTRIFNEVGKKFNITGFPWVSCFYQGEKTDDMAGLGGADSVINWANKKIDDHNPSGASAPAAPAPSSGMIDRSRCFLMITWKTLIFWPTV
jgi:thioredoxin-like negative regulator of GroEL